MAGWNGSGGFTNVYDWNADAAAGILIIASRMQGDFDNISTVGFANCLTRDGQGVPSANLPMNGFQHTGAAAATATGQYLTWDQLQTPGSMAIFATTITTSGNATIGGNATVGNGLSVTTGNLAISAGNLGVTGTGTFSGTLSSGALTVTGTAGISGLLTAGGVQSVNIAATAAIGCDSISVANVANVGGAMTVGSSLTVSGGVNGGAGVVSSFGAVQTSGAVASLQSGWLYTNIGGGASTGSFNYGVLMVGSGALGAYFFANSDRRLKHDIETIDADDGLAWLMKARPVTYRKKPRYQSSLEEAVPEAGFIAQEQAAAGYAQYVAVTPHEGMPGGDDGEPEGMELSLNTSYQVAYLTAALKAALERIEKLEKSR